MKNKEKKNKQVKNELKGKVTGYKDINVYYAELEIERQLQNKLAPEIAMAKQKISVFKTENKFVGILPSFTEDLNYNIDILFTEAHPRIKEYSKTFLKLPETLQLQIMKVIMSNRVAFDVQGNDRTIYMKVFYDLYKDLFIDEKLDDEQKRFIFRFLD